MNLLINPTFTNGQLATEFLAVQDATLTLDRWYGISDTNGRIDVRQRKAPSRVEIEFNSAGWGGLSQTVENEMFADAVGETRIVALDAWKTGSVGKITVDVVEWLGVVNQPTEDIVSSWGSSLMLGSNWSLVASQEFDLTTTRTRLALDPITVPDASNIAVIVRANGAAGDKVFLTKVSMDETAAFVGRSPIEETQLCEWFLQVYSYPELNNTEFPYGMMDTGNVLHMIYPLRHQLRGVLGGPGDVEVTWTALSTSGVPNAAWWVYGAGVAVRITSIELSCHHRQMLMFYAQCSAGMARYNSCVARPYGINGRLIFNAELRP